jgi:hypothetical protein
MVCGAVLALVEVEETIPNMLSDPRLGDAANAAFGPARTNKRQTTNAAAIELILNFPIFSVFILVNLLSKYHVFFR